MPTFTSYPDPKVVGSVAQDDKGWSWIYNGSAWDSLGFVQQYNPFGGFAGPYLPATTDPTMITVKSSGNGFNNSPWGEGVSSEETDVFGDVTATSGYWIVQDFGSSAADFATLDAQNIYLAMPYTAGSASPMAGSTFNASQTMSASDWSSWQAFVTDGTYEAIAANDASAALTSNRRFNSTRRVGRNANAVTKDIGYVQMNTNSSGSFSAHGTKTVSQSAAATDLIKCTVSTSAKSSAFGVFAGLSNGDTVEFRRGEMVDGFWQTSLETSVGKTEYPGSGGYYRYAVYELYTRITTP